MTDSPTLCGDLERARALVAAVVHDDLSEAEAEEDLRDYGLDSIRLLSIVDALRRDGLRVRIEELAGRPTLGGLADAIANASAHASHSVASSVANPSSNTAPTAASTAASTASSTPEATPESTARSTTSSPAEENA